MGLEEMVSRIGLPSRVCVKPFPGQGGDPASLRPASSGDRKRVLVVRGNFAAERLARRANDASVRNALGALFLQGASVVPVQ